ncbi:MAG TPA: hypothetical protein VN649_04675 [Ramlibacter sp.]|nr:hypothetical protein [Ramlibacter sp.]
MDDIRAAFWESFRYLFPPHAKAVQTGSGNLMISWALQGDPYARFAHATPIAIRFEEELIQTMRAADPQQRLGIAKRHEGVVKAGMVGYDPYTAVPKARVIVLG